MLNTMWKIPPCRNMYVASCQTQKYRTTKMGRRPSTSVTIEKKNCPRNMTTLAPISAFRAVESGPGPNEKEEAYSEEFRRMVRTGIVLHPGGAATVCRPGLHSVSNFRTRP